MQRRHRILSLLAHTHLIALAAEEGAESVLVLEGDVRPVRRHALSLKDVRTLSADLSSSTSWQVIRPTGYHHAFGSFRSSFFSPRGDGIANACPAQCACRRFGSSRRACVVAAAGQEAGVAAEATAEAAPLNPAPLFSAPLNRTSINLNSAPLHLNYSGRCDVRNSEAYAVHRRGFAPFLELRRRALAALQQAEATAAGAEAAQKSRGPHSRAVGGGASGRRRHEERLPSSAVLRPLSLDSASLPWQDLFLAARFDAVYITPQLVVQQASGILLIGPCRKSVRTSSHLLSPLNPANSHPMFLILRQVRKHEVFTSELFYSTCVEGAEPGLKARLRRKHLRLFERASGARRSKADG